MLKEEWIKTKYIEFFSSISLAQKQRVSKVALPKKILNRRNRKKVLQKPFFRYKLVTDYNP
jgi:hypothetical protein